MFKVQGLMKTFQRALLSAVFCIMSVWAVVPTSVQAQATQCGGSPLVGIWLSGLGRLEFKADCTGRHYLDEGFGVPPFSHPFKWSASGNQLTWQGAGFQDPAPFSIQKGVLTIGEDWYLDRL